MRKVRLHTESVTVPVQPNSTNLDSNYMRLFTPSDIPISKYSKGVYPPSPELDADGEVIPDVT